MAGDSHTTVVLERNKNLVVERHTNMVVGRNVVRLAKEHIWGHFSADYCLSSSSNALARVICLGRDGSDTLLNYLAWFGELHQHCRKRKKVIGFSLRLKVPRFNETYKALNIFAYDCRRAARAAVTGEESSAKPVAWSESNDGQSVS
jgi:hypothetical protein